MSATENIRIGLQLFQLHKAVIVRRESLLQYLIYFPTKAFACISTGWYMAGV